MKNIRKLLALLLCAALVLSLMACGKAPEPTDPPAPPTEPPTEAPTEPPVVDAYEEAAAALQAKDSMTLKVTSSETRKVSGETLTSSSKQTIIVTADAISAEIADTLGDYTTDYVQYYDGTSAYGSLGDYVWKTDMSRDDFLQHLVPAVLLTGDLYGSVTAGQDGTNTVYTFADPAAGESWTVPAEADLISATGEATVDANGNLTRSDYAVSYTVGNTQVEQKTTVIISDAAAVELPLETTEAVELESYDAPFLMDKAFLNLYQANAMTSTITRTTFSAIAEVTLTNQYQFDTYGTGTGYKFNIQNTITSQDLSGATESFSQIENFQNGTYTWSSQGYPDESQQMSYSQLQPYCLSSITGGMWDAAWLTAATVTDLGSTYLVKYTGNEDLGELYVLDASSLIFDDENILNDNATGYSTTMLEGLLAIDKFTGMPTAVGYDYVGSHIIDGAPYMLADSWTQGINVGNPEAYTTITGEALPEEEPAEKATPLFYRVTGPDGQEMWLMGTIHLGDERTAYLPQEIYDALAGSDALAVEFDTDAFTAQMNADPTLATQIALAYCYTDGTTTADHLDPELYQNALYHLMATGTFNASMLVMKPAFLSQSIENFYIQQHSNLHFTKGVDSRLMAYARKNGIAIRDIESGMFQIQMFSDYSDDLQELLLKMSLDTSSIEFCDDTQELYEQWCAGDEATLRDIIMEAPTDLTAEELPLYEEYRQSMNIDRNEGMLQVAIDYLESGDTIFYAVGLAHLLDTENGLVDTLRNAGYTVELVSFN